MVAVKDPRTYLQSLSNRTHQSNRISPTRKIWSCQQCPYFPPSFQFPLHRFETFHQLIIIVLAVQINNMTSLVSAIKLSSSVSSISSSLWMFPFVTVFVVKVLFYPRRERFICATRFSLIGTFLSRNKGTNRFWPVCWIRALIFVWLSCDFFFVVMQVIFSNSTARTLLRTIIMIARCQTISFRVRKRRFKQHSTFRKLTVPKGSCHSHDRHLRRTSEAWRKSSEPSFGDLPRITSLIVPIISFWPLVCVPNGAIIYSCGFVPTEDRIPREMQRILFLGKSNHVIFSTCIIVWSIQSPTSNFVGSTFFPRKIRSSEDRPVMCVCVCVRRDFRARTTTTGFGTNFFYVSKDEPRISSTIPVPKMSTVHPHHHPHFRYAGLVEHDKNIRDRILLHRCFNAKYTRDHLPESNHGPTVRILRTSFFPYNTLISVISLPFLDPWTSCSINKRLSFAFDAVLTIDIGPFHQVQWLWKRGTNSRIPYVTSRPTNAICVLYWEKDSSFFSKISNWMKKFLQFTSEREWESGTLLSIFLQSNEKLKTHTSRVDRKTCRQTARQREKETVWVGRATHNKVRFGVR